MSPVGPPPRRAPSWWGAASAALAVATVALAGWTTHALQGDQLRRAAEQQLATMAELKRDQLGAWIDGQRRFASAAATVLAPELERELRGGATSREVSGQWQARLQALRDLGGYAEVSLYRAAGGLLASSEPAPGPPPGPALLSAAARGDVPVVSSVHRPGRAGGPLTVFVAARVTTADGDGLRLTWAVLVVRLDPASTLLPMTRAWPTPIRTAEVVLGEADGDEVVSLRELREREVALQEVRVPRADRRSLMAQAAAGGRGLLEGVDERGVPVLGAAVQVPGTRWLLVAKEDRAERFAPLWPRTLGITAAAAALVLAAALVFRASLRQRSAALAAQGIEEARLMLEAVLDAIPARVFWKDRALRYLGSNRAFAGDAGVSGPEGLVGKDDAELPWAEQAEAYRAGDREVLAGTARLGVEEEVRTAAGRTVWVRTNKVPLRGPDGEIRGVLGTLEDLTPQKQAEAAARAEQARVQAVLENAGFGISITDREGRMLESNPEWARFLGYGLSELAAITIADVTHPEDREASQRNLEGVYSGAIASYTQEKRYLRKDGEVVWGLLAVTPIHDPDGRIRSAIGIVADITERKRIETELALTADRLALATGAAAVGIWDWDVQRDVLVWDDAMLRLYGLRREEFAGSYAEWERAIEPADRPRARASIEAALAGERDLATEFRVRWPDGAVRHLQAAARTIRDSAGRPARMVGVNFDITARKVSEEQLRASERFLKAVTDALPGLVGYWDRELRSRFANQQYFEWFGKTPEEMRTVTMPELLGPELYARNEPYVRRALAGEAQRFEQLSLKRDGTPRQSWVHYIPDLADGEVRGFFVLVSDISELKKAQEETERLNEALRERTRQAEAASRAKSEFVANMSHEIRTPMNAILGLGHLLQASPLSAKQRDYLARLHGAARSLLALIDDVLDLSKIEASKLEVEHVAFDLRDVLRHVESLMAEKAREKGLALRCELPPDVPALLAGDPLRLGQVLLNLASNAVKFTDRGWVAVAVRVVEAQAGAVRLRFSVRDTGIGIPADALQRIFQPFSQADASTTRRFGGTGLGLSIARRLVELMGGELGVQSTPGEGSTFSFVLPLERRDDRAAGVPAVVARPVPAPGRHQGRVLVAEDNETNRIVVLELLQGAGLEVEEALDGREAVAKALAPGARFDLVLMDVQMPEMDGFEATARIHEVLPELPIVAMTAHAMGNERQRCLEAGMVDHVAKPFEPARIGEVLDRWLPAALAAPPDGVGEGARIGDERFLAALGRDLDACADRLRRACSAGDARLAAEAAHALKGLAVPAPHARVRDRARALEQAVKDGAPWLAQADALQQSVGEVVAGMRRAAGAAPEARATAQRPSPEELRALLRQTAAKLRRRSLGAKDHVDALRAWIGPDPLLRRLEDSLDGVDFAAAELALAELAEALGMEM